MQSKLFNTICFNWINSSTPSLFWQQSFARVYCFGWLERHLRYNGWTMNRDSSLNNDFWSNILVSDQTKTFQIQNDPEMNKYFYSQYFYIRWISEFERNCPSTNSNLSIQKQCYQLIMACVQLTNGPGSNDSCSKTSEKEKGSANYSLTFRLWRGCFIVSYNREIFHSFSRTNVIEFAFVLIKSYFGKIGNSDFAHRKDTPLDRLYE